MVDISKSLEENIDALRKWRERGRDSLVSKHAIFFQWHVEVTKQHMLNSVASIEPQWRTKLIGIVFPKRLERAAIREVEESNRRELERYEQITSEYEMNDRQYYEAEQKDRSRRLHAVALRRQRTDREPERER